MDDEVLKRRLVGLFTLAVAAFLLSWLLPRPGLERLRAHGERVVTIDLTRPDSLPEERAAAAAESAAVESRLAGQVESGLAESPDAQTPATAEEAPASAAASAPEPAPTAVESESAPKPEPQPDPKPEPRPAPKPEPKPEPKTAPKPAPPAVAGGKVQVQAGAYSHLDKAEGVRAKAATQGVSCAIAPAETAKGTLYRVRCGPYADRAAADGVIRRLGGVGIAAQVVSGGR